ncbi:DUF72 domain-containing protein [Azohydromonas caseinilytica]|uniref:DUF72 domain-containing protein n=1 Tax=Azohydromonas caseinilytica TaxID=2728836 RepID=A0A848FEY2_9BURK|nr:DUF72 domain-containing protein [Azohydromonas caseinilytica]NML17395.1 DUF72 domain-containing protein [Azohydromonas caseinilytica]
MTNSSFLQSTLFNEPPLEVATVQPAPIDVELQELAHRLNERWDGRLHLGTSSWNFSGWAGLVWAQAYPEARLSREGLQAYAAHPLLRTVSLDRAFYRPLEAAAYATLAAQVPAGFRFVVKAAALVSDAVRRDAGGRAERSNPSFLDAQMALEQCLRPAVQGLGEKLGVLVFQLSPLPPAWLHDPVRLEAQLDRLWQALLPEVPSGSRLALELRDPELLQPWLAAHLKAHGVRYCLGLHDRMPGLDQQLPLLRATWPGDLVCRWNLQRGQSYASAKDRWAPFDKLCAPDLSTRQGLARVIGGTLSAGRSVYVTINNKAEGCAPCSVLELARALAGMSA